MGNSVCIRREREMSHLQPHLGDTRWQQLRSSPFAPIPLFHSPLVKDGEEFLLKKPPPKTLRASSPIKISPFMIPSTIRKEAAAGNSPMGDNPQAVTSRFPPIRGIQTSEVTRVIFYPTSGAKGEVAPLPNDYLTSTNPPVGGSLCSFRRD